ncbi:alpha/beta hydrolase [Azospirillum sp. SYSU D00513]|uniref:alpha/beta hydrolase n=1 Tax=Azospirillum sp. SYSU D00513 TaxID=2812561 RepID=UPI001A979901|nr:alpha/beta hydrolase [Azospirillum sp. SYSU D00513]
MTGQSGQGRRAPWMAGAAALLLLSACQSAKDLGTATVNAPVEAAKGTPTLADADTDMAGVLLAFQALGPKPIETLTAGEARQQPTPADAVKKYLQDRGMNAAPEPVASVRNITIPGPASALTARVYKPHGASGRLPVIVYFHGGGWVIATNDTYDSSARALANQSGAIVVSVEYRKGPEAKFPAAHQDALAAYRWALRNAGQLGGDPARVAVAGESAGGSLAIGVSRLARQQGLALPVHQLLVYPIAGSDLNTPSYQENATAKPLNRAMMAWFFDKYLRNQQDRKDPLIDVVNAPDLAGLPPTTIIMDEIDPLRSEGQMLAERLRMAGVPVESRNYDDVTHEFFGMGAAVAKAKDAQAFAGSRLRQSFGSTPRS